jgi:hypothetical protein
VRRRIWTTVLPAGDVFGLRVACAMHATAFVFCDDRPSDPGAASAYLGVFGRDGFGVLDCLCYGLLLTADYLR